MTQTPLPDKDTIEQVDESRVYAHDSADGSFVALEVNAAGELVVDTNSGTVNLQDTGPVTATTTATGASNAASLDLGTYRKDVDLFYDLSGSATVTIDVSTDNATWRTFQTIDQSSASADVAQISTAYRYVRAYADANLNTLEMSSKGD